MLRCVALVRTDVSEDLSASFIRVTEWRTRRLLVAASVFPSSSILVTRIKEGLSSSEMSVLTRATRRSIIGRHHSSWSPPWKPQILQDIGYLCILGSKYNICNEIIITVVIMCVVSVSLQTRMGMYRHLITLWRCVIASILIEKSDDSLGRGQLHSIVPVGLCYSALKFYCTVWRTIFS
jgi:hypothetical protein